MLCYSIFFFLRSFNFIFDKKLVINLQRRKLRVVPDAIKAVDQDRGINAPVRYFLIKPEILPFLDLNVDTAEIVMVRSLQDHELLIPMTTVIKVKTVRKVRYN